MIRPKRYTEAITKYKQTIDGFKNASDKKAYVTAVFNMEHKRSSTVVKQMKEQLKTMEAQNKQQEEQLEEQLKTMKAQHKEQEAQMKEQIKLTKAQESEQKEQQIQQYIDNFDVELLKTMNKEYAKKYIYSLDMSWSYKTRLLKDFVSEGKYNALYSCIKNGVVKTNTNNPVVATIERMVDFAILNYDYPLNKCNFTDIRNGRFHITDDISMPIDNPEQVISEVSKGYFKKGIKIANDCLELKEDNKCIRTMNCSVIDFLVE